MWLRVVPIVSSPLLAQGTGRNRTVQAITGGQPSNLAFYDYAPAISSFTSPTGLSTTGGDVLTVRLRSVS